MSFYIYEFYANSDKDEFLVDWFSDEQIANIAKECGYDFVKCYESVGMGCKGKFLYEKELEACNISSNTTIKKTESGNSPSNQQQTSISSSTTSK